MTPTLCRECEHVEAVSRKQPPHRWLCLMHRRLADPGFVDPDWWTNNAPFLFCKDVNAGACLLFEPKREKPNGQED